MKNITLVIMAAGIGSRFGGGIKQLAPVGPNDEIIMDYSIYDAKEAGFNKVVFVIRKDLEEEFDRVIGSRIKQVIDVEYVFQELNNIPEVYQEQIAMVSFILKNTLSDNGGVTRGICSVNEDNHLIDIVETHNIEKGNNCAFVKAGEDMINIDLQVPVSMNMWALQPGIFEILERKFKEFLSQLDDEDIKAEYLLPTIIGDLLKEEKADVTVLKSLDNWFGVTYQEDKQSDSIKELISAGIYPDKLY